MHFIVEPKQKPKEKNTQIKPPTCYLTAGHLDVQLTYSEHVYFFKCTYRSVFSAKELHFEHTKKLQSIFYFFRHRIFSL